MPQYLIEYFYLLANVIFIFKRNGSWEKQLWARIQAKRFLYMHLMEEFWQQNHILFLVVSSLNEDKYSLHYYTAFAFHCSYTFE